MPETDEISRNALGPGTPAMAPAPEADLANWTAWAEGRAAAEVLAGLRGALAAAPEATSHLHALLGATLLRAGDMREAVSALLAAAAQPTPQPSWLGAEVARALVAVKDGRVTVPPAVEEDIDRFVAIVSAVLEGRSTDALPRPGTAVLPRSLALLWMLRRPVTLDATAMSAEARERLVSAHGLSPRFLAAAQKGHRGVSEACLGLFPEIPTGRIAALSPRIRELAGAVQLDGKPFLCPFTGERALIGHNITTDAMAYRGAGRACLVLRGRSLMEASLDVGWVLLDQPLFLFVPEEDVRLRRLRVQAADALAEVYHQAGRLAPYFAAPTRGIVVHEPPTPHMGHALWNRVSAWSRLFRLVRPQQLAAMVVNTEGQHPFGGMPTLFPEAQEGEIIRARDPRRVLALVRDRRATLLSAADDHVTEDAARRVLQWARSNCPAEDQARIAGLRAAASPLLLVTLRLGNRAWIEQEEGYIQLLRALHAAYPRLGVVLDGLNATSTAYRAHPDMTLAAELALAERIRVALEGAMPVHDSIGCPLPESLLLCEAVDAYVAPIGAGMAKSRWIANKPGVAFSNLTMLDPGNIHGSLYDTPAYRDAPVPSWRVDPARVRDVRAPGQGPHMRDSFHLDWEELLRVTRLLLTSLGFTADADGVPPRPGNEPAALP